MNNNQNVSVLCRQSGSDAGQCGLVLGVFPNSTAARAFAEVMENAPFDRWQPPRPGKRWWTLESRAYVFTIEEFPLRNEHQQPQPEQVLFAAD